MNQFTLRRACSCDKEAIRLFLNTYWGSDHPLVNRDDLFAYYYQDEKAPGMLHFCLAEDENGIAAICGYIPSSLASEPDVWASIWCARKNAKGAGLALMGKMKELTGCRVLACNNIRENTMSFYTFLGYTALRLPHYYRLSEKSDFKVARIARPEILPAGGSAVFFEIQDEKELALAYTPNAALRPYKDLWYIARRYLHYPVQNYLLLGAGRGDGKASALLACRLVNVNGVNVLRIVDYIGEPTYFAELGSAIDAFMKEKKAEYADFYCYGIAKEILQKAGFCERARDDVNILPNYLDPPLYENTEYFFFTSEAEGFTMFKADGDQDRPNLG